MKKYTLKQKQGPRVKFTLRLTSDLLRRIEASAAKACLPMNEWMVQRLDRDTPNLNSLEHWL